MAILESYPLDLNRTLLYLKENLEEANALSDAILKHTQFEMGEFYTILREGITEDRLYGFKWGRVGGGVREKAAEIVFDELHSIKGSCCIFDSFDDDYEPDYDDPLFLRVGVHYDKQIYYVVSGEEGGEREGEGGGKGEEVTKSLLEECFRASNVIWHSLCVLGRASFSKREDASITEAEIRGLAEAAELVILGAYDSEGYVFWKRGKG